MVYKCAAINCKSGYSSEEKKLNNMYHSFLLKDDELPCNWLKNIAKKNFKHSKYSKLCSLLFKPDDFIEVSYDSNQRRKRKRDSEHLCYRTGDGNVFFPVCQVVKFNVKIYVCMPMSSLRFHLRFPYFFPKIRMFSKKKKKVFTLISSLNVFLKNIYDAACRIKSPRVP